MLYIFWFLHQTTTREQQQYFCFWLYIFWFLHQTTTQTKATAICKRCISFDSYIKPQPCVIVIGNRTSCISFDSYIKPQLDSYHIRITCVVYLLIPTSNHNPLLIHQVHKLLYIFWFLHQTTTWSWLVCSSICCISFDSYIKPQHNGAHSRISTCCISFDSYIKPQPVRRTTGRKHVVYLLIPTSNHNTRTAVFSPTWLYIFWFLHQTTTYRI